MQQLKTMCVVAIAILAVPPAWADKSEVTKGRVEAVTVYRGQALVTRTVDLAGPGGLREIVVTGLPEHVVPGSLYAESGEGVEVRSVRYRVRPVKDDVRQEVREITKQLREVDDKLSANSRKVQLIAEKGTYLDRLQEFTVPTVHFELATGVLNAETLKSLTGFLFDQRQEISEQGLRLSLQERDLRTERQLLESRLQVLSGSSRTVREAVVFVNLIGDGGGLLRLRYLVDQATWSPYYNVRVGADRQAVNVEYYASVRQTSGEDWPDVAMTLSTATPNLAAKAPELASLRIALGPINHPQQGASGLHTKKGYDEAVADLLRRRKGVENRRALQAQLQQQGQQRMQQAAVPGGKGGDYDEVLNALALDIQVLDLNLGKVQRKGRPAVPAVDEGVSVTYRIASRTTLPSRSDRQLIQIAALPMPADFYRVAIPVLTDHVYEEAGVTNNGDMVLLAGPLATYVDGEFVGNGELPTIAVGEQFTVGLGIDPSLRISRELAKKKDRVQGGNRIVDLAYRLGIENFGSEPVAVRLFDRLPQTTGSDVKVTFDSKAASLSTEPTYLKTDHKKGILRWDVQAPAQATGPDALSVEYQFRLEYDKQMTITGLAATTG